MYVVTVRTPNLVCEDSMKNCLEYCSKAGDFYGPVARTIVEDFTPVGPVIKVLRPVGKLIYEGAVSAANNFEINLSSVTSVQEWLLDFKDGISTKVDYSCAWSCSKFTSCDLYAFCESTEFISDVKTRFCDIVIDQTASSFEKKSDDEEKLSLAIA